MVHSLKSQLAYSCLTIVTIDRYMSWRWMTYCDDEWHMFKDKIYWYTVSKVNSLLNLRSQVICVIMLRDMSFIITMCHSSSRYFIMHHDMSFIATTCHSSSRHGIMHYDVSFIITICHSSPRHVTIDRYDCKASVSLWIYECQSSVSLSIYGRTSFASLPITIWHWYTMIQMTCDIWWLYVQDNDCANNTKI